MSIKKRIESLENVTVIDEYLDEKAIEIEWSRPEYCNAITKKGKPCKGGLAFGLNQVYITFKKRTTQNFPKGTGMAIYLCSKHRDILEETGILKLLL